MNSIKIVDKRGIQMIKTNDEPGPAVRCECGNVLGHEVTIGGLDRLKIGGLVVQSAHGACERCGREFHWSMSDKMLARLIVRVRELHA